MALITIILTKNEERHISRALASVAAISDRCVVVDSGSTDRTRELAWKHGAQVLERPWTNHATQFNWALDQMPPDTEWVLRLDADEYVTPLLASQIKQFLADPPEEVAGLVVSRRMHFMGQPIRWGGLFPLRIVRIFRHGKGRCESRWMDEHILVEGATVDLAGEIIDDNLNSLTWWTEKHNSYASREVVDLLNLEYGFMPLKTAADNRSSKQTSLKRWLKEKVYSRLPNGFRAFAYFFYRYILRFGFLDGKEGTAFHVLQGFWYRYLVDMKLHEVKAYMKNRDVDVVKAIRDVLKIDIRQSR